MENKKFGVTTIVLCVLILPCVFLSNCSTREGEEESSNTPELDKKWKHCMEVCMPKDPLRPQATPEELEARKKEIDNIGECLKNCQGNNNDTERQTAEQIKKLLKKDN